MAHVATPTRISRSRDSFPKPRWSRKPDLVQRRASVKISTTGWEMNSQVQLSSYRTSPRRQLTGQHSRLSWRTCRSKVISKDSTRLLWLWTVVAGLMLYSWNLSKLAMLQMCRCKCQCSRVKDVLLISLIPLWLSGSKWSGRTTMSMVMASWIWRKLGDSSRKTWVAKLAMPVLTLSGLAWTQMALAAYQSMNSPAIFNQSAKNNTELNKSF